MTCMRRMAWMPFALVAGCNSVLGVEPLKPEAAPDAATSMTESPSSGEAGAGGDAAKPAAGGGGGGGRTGTGDPSAGRAAETERGGAGGENEAEGGAGGPSMPNGASGTGAAGTTAAAGGSGEAGSSAAPSGGPVDGQLIDNRMHVVAGATVMIGERRTTTDDAGKFHFDAAPESYTITITWTVPFRGGPSRMAWSYEGLTRRDPTLQMYRALPVRNTSLELWVTNFAMPLPAKHSFLTGWVSPDGEYNDDSETAGYVTDIEWSGSESSPGLVYALEIERDDAELPVAYHAYDSKPLTLEAGATGTKVELDLTPESIVGSTVSGSVSGSMQNRSVTVYLRKDPNTAIELLSEWRGQSSFSYIVPSFPDADFTVVASDIANGRGQGSSAYVIDHVTPGMSGLALPLPALPLALAPAYGQVDVDGDTRFEWQNQAPVSLFCAFAVANYDMMCVLTGQRATTLPVSPKSDFVAPAGAEYHWSVETHGDFATVDDAARPEGFISPYATGRVLGTKRGSGPYAISAEQLFTIKP